MTTNENISAIGERILFVDPNKVNGTIDGNPITPDYSDMCISFNLICEVKSRFKTGGYGKANPRDRATSSEDFAYSVYWTWSYETPTTDDNDEEGGTNRKKWVSFMRGRRLSDDASNETALTTFYTDLSNDDMKTGDIVEGLGVENVTVAFESYYTPTITIKFVDVRGASLFGMEEATHKNDKLTRDNVFGAFFTAPYPKFRLQIKGFYGKPVTYQLTCSNFRGSFNSQTGNYEAVATFIGYSYSLLTDIPFQYLVAAPYCDYVGTAYWASNRNTSSWRLYGNSIMITLYDLFRNIRSAGNNAELLSGNKPERIAELEDQKKYLSRAKSAINDFVILFRTLSRSTNNGNAIKLIDVDQKENSTANFLVYSENGNTDIFKGCLDGWKTVADVIEKNDKAINKIMGDTKINATEFGPDWSYDATDTSKCIKFIDISTIKPKDDNVSISGQEIDEMLYQELLQQNGITKGYLYYFAIGDVIHRIDMAIENCDESIAKQSKSYARDYKRLAKSNLGVIPTMGNIFKIIMAHLETFIEMMRSCAEVIYDDTAAGRRTSNFFNVQLTRTDVPDVSLDISERGTQNLPPWVMIVNEERENDDDSPFGWVGDISTEFEEERLVKALFFACKKTQGEERLSNRQIQNINYIPILGCDIDKINSPSFGYSPINFNVNKKSTYNKIGSVLGTRIAQLFGISYKDADTAFAQKCAKIDAANFKILNNKIDSTSISSTDITSGKDSTFKTTQTNRNNACVFIEEGSNYIYNDTSTNPKVAGTPIDAQSFESIVNRSENNMRTEDLLDNKFWEYEDKFLHVCSSDKIMGDTSKNDVRKYVNEPMFNVLSRDYGIIKGVLNKLREFYDNDKEVKFQDITFNKSDSITENAFKYEISQSSYEQKIKSALEKISTGYGKGENATDNYFFNQKDITTLSIGKIDKIMGEPVGSYDKLNEGKIHEIISCIDKKSPLFASDDMYTFMSLANSSDEENSALNIINLLFFFLSSLYYTMYGEPSSGQENPYTGKKHVLVIPRITVLLDGYSLLYKKLNTSPIDSLLPYSFEKKYNGAVPHYVENKLMMIALEESDDLLTAIQNLTLKGTNGSLPNSVNLLDIIKNGLNMGKQVFDAQNTASEELKTENEQLLSWNTEAWNANTQLREELTKKDKELRQMQMNNILYNGFGFRTGTFGNITTPFNTSSFNMGSFGFSNSGGTFTLQNITGININATTPTTPTTDDENTENTENTESTENTDEELNKALEMICANMVRNGFVNNLSNFEKNYAWLGTVDLYDGKIDYNKPENFNIETQTLKLLISDSCPTQQYLVWLTTDENLVLTTPQDVNSDSNSITVSKTVADAYIDKFCEVWNQSIRNTQELSENELLAQTKPEVKVYEDESEFTRDVAIPIYMYLKMLWDRWLISIDDWENHEFTVANFYKNFIFMDSFYRNISNRFMMDCQVLVDAFDNNRYSNQDVTLFKYIGDITTAHHCMFLAVPDFIDDLGSECYANAVNALADMFRPVPFIDKEGMHNNNKFVVVYVPKLSETPSELNNFREDGFNIWSQDNVGGFIDVLPQLPKPLITPIESGEGEGRYGYYIPAFGVAYGQQNNSIFKNINLSMETPVITSSVINTLSHISQRGAANEHKVAFIGQDLYPVYSNYSYICEFEMMGCAQIQPLMYFQLFNVPMWRGTYMIFNVTHEMRPGDMVTKVKAMKLSRIAMPYSERWFAKNFSFSEDIDELCNRALSGLNIEGGGSVNGSSSGDININQVESNDGATDDNQSGGGSSDQPYYIPRNASWDNKYLIVGDSQASRLYKIIKSHYGNKDCPYISLAIGGDNNYQGSVSATDKSQGCTSKMTGYECGCKLGWKKTARPHDTWGGSSWCGQLKDGEVIHNIGASVQIKLYAAAGNKCKSIISWTGWNCDNKKGYKEMSKQAQKTGANKIYNLSIDKDWNNCCDCKLRNDPSLSRTETQGMAVPFDTIYFPHNDTTKKWRGECDYSSDGHIKSTDKSWQVIKKFLLYKGLPVP